MISKSIFLYSSLGGLILRNNRISKRNNVNNKTGKTYNVKLLRNHVKFNPKTADINTFSEDEKGEYKLPIFIVKLIANIYGADLMCRIRQARITRGTKIIDIVTSAIMEADRALIMLIK